MTPPPPALANPIANDIEWRGLFQNAEVNTLHAECFKHQPVDDDWWSRINQHSLGWVCVRQSEKLVGFVNVAWDGGVHAFILDTMVSPAFQRQGIAMALIEEAMARARHSGCEWLHVDFEPHLRPFYLDACGFKPTDAGLVHLK